MFLYVITTGQEGRTRSSEEEWRFTAFNQKKRISAYPCDVHWSLCETIDICALGDVDLIFHVHVGFEKISFIELFVSEAVLGSLLSDSAPSMHAACIDQALPDRALGTCNDALAPVGPRRKHVLMRVPRQSDALAFLCVQEVEYSSLGRPFAVVCVQEMEHTSLDRALGV